jgi:hypothetical protein
MKLSVLSLSTAIKLFKADTEGDYLSPIEKGSTIQSLIDNRQVKDIEEAAKKLKISIRSAYRFVSYHHELSPEEKDELIRIKAIVRGIDSVIDQKKTSKIIITFGRKKTTIKVQKQGRLDPIQRRQIKAIKEILKVKNFST